MEIDVTDPTGLPEALQPLVAEGKLDLSKLMPAEDLTGLKTALQKERANVGEYAKLGKPGEIADRMAALESAAAKPGKAGEEAQAKLDAMKADYDAKLADRDGRLSKLMQSRATSDLKAELAKAGIIPEGIDMLASFAAQRIQFNDDGTPKVLTSDGKPMIGSGADHGATLMDLAKELAGSNPYLVKDGGVGGGGKPPGSNGGKPDQKTVTREAFEAMSQTERMSHSKSGGKVKG